MDTKISFHVKLPNAYQSKGVCVIPFRCHTPQTPWKWYAVVMKEKGKLLQWTFEELEASIQLNW